MRKSHRRLTQLVAALFFTTLPAACGDPPTDPRSLLQPQVARLDRSVSITAMPIHEIAPGDFGIATDIAEDGTITGSVGLSSPRPFLWREGVLTTLPVPAGASYAQSQALNESGHLAIRAWFAGEPPRARSFLWTPESGYTDIGTLGHTSAQVWGMNDLDHMVGYSAVSSVFPAAQAFIWKPGGPMTTLVPEFFSVAADINNSGDVIINGPGARLKRADGTITYLIGGSQVLDLNEHGASVGHRVLSFNFPLLIHAYTWDRHGTPVDLTPDLTEGRGSATAINDDGVIAGYIELQPFVWVNGRRYALATLGDVAYPAAINNAGRIVGYARTASGNVPVYWDVLRVPAVVLGDLTTRITALVETGAVGAGPAHALLRIVEQATRAVDDDRIAAARAQLRAFVALVRTQEGSGQLAAAQAAELVALAEEALAML